MVHSGRRNAIGAARSIIRAMNCNPKQYSADDALTVLDDLLRTEPELLASQWYRLASENQIRLFRSEWQAWQKQQ